jgi:four helix bundle protein
MNKEELENRLILFAINVSLICQQIKRTELGVNLSSQLIRSAVSPALNYAEAQGAESRRDFVHKMRIALKELRESHVSLRIIDKANICANVNELSKVIDEANQLISIFVSSIRTAESTSHHKS